MEIGVSRGALQVAGTAFVILFCIVGLALWGLPFYYDFMVQQFGLDAGPGDFGKRPKQIGGADQFLDSSPGGSSIASVRAV